MDVERNTPTAEPAGVTEQSALAADAGTGAPPSYDSLYGRLKSVKGESSGPKDCFTRFMKVLCASVIGTILLLPVLAVPLAMIGVGAVHLHDCPVERYIPIYLIVGGCFGAVQIILTTALRIRNQVTKNEEENSRPNPGSGLITCFLLAWFITGSVWVYRCYSYVTTSEPKSLYYCHPAPYWFTFILITAGYISLAFSCCCCLTAAICVGCLSFNEPEQGEQT